ncbi:methyl-accepting chemotaxis protein [Gynuella sp.]|uniref:methyl-accepting chemotaxis protein n=1 Tax=Gynuella sp. TaxID=2969146 RepID=UPI003D0C1CC0
MNLSLQSKLIVASAFIIAIISVSLGWVAYSQLDSARDDAIFSETNAQAGAFRRYLESWAEDRHATMAAMRHALEANIRSNNDTLDHQVALDVLNQGKTGGEFALTFVGLEDGTMYRHDPSLDKAGYDPRVRGWYTAAKASNQPLITKPYIAVTGNKLAITFVAPVIINGQFRGAIGGLFYMDKILSDIVNLKVMGDGYAMLLDKRDVIAVHPDKSLILKTPDTLNEQFTSSSLTRMSETPQIYDVSVSGQNTLVYLDAVPATDWVLALVMQKSVLAEPLRALTVKIVLIVVCLLVVATVGTLLMVRWLFTDIKTVSGGLENIADGNGDLTLRITTSSDDEIGMLANNFNRFVGFLHGIISSLRDIGDVLVTQANSTQQSATLSAEKIHMQQEEITMVATAVHEMTVATQEIAGNASTTAKTSDDAVRLSDNGQQQVKKSQESINKLADEVGRTSKVISDLDEHVQQISSILGTISGIAEQTNLLALNAAIEAARAGEQGRGFAVVADEVRVLSQRTHASTEEIQNMIEVLQTSTKQAVSSMEASHKLAGLSVLDADAANASLIEIRSAISTINEMATQIATAAEEQTSVTTEINQNTTNIHSASQELALVAEESAEQAKELNKLSERLRKDIGLFSL